MQATAGGGDGDTRAGGGGTGDQNKVLAIFCAAISELAVTVVSHPVKLPLV